MTITVSPLADKTIASTIGAGALPSALVNLVSDSTPSLESTFYDSNILESTGVTVWNEYEIQTSLESSPTLENLSACQTLTSRVVAPVGDGGIGRIRVTNAALSSIIKCDTTKRGGQTIRSFFGYTPGTISKYLYDQVHDLLVENPDTDYYSTYNHTTGTYTRNASCWGASIDLSCVAVASSYVGGWTRQRGGTLISPRHILLAAHYPLVVGDQVRFTDAAGTLETKTVIGTSAASAAGDFRVGVLDSAVTVATPCAVAGSWMIQGETNSNHIKRFYSGGLAIHTSQNAELFACSISFPASLSLSGTLDATIAGQQFNDLGIGWVDHNTSVIPAEFASSVSTPIPGDSGQPVFLIIEGEPVLLWVWLFTIGGPPAYAENGAILNALIVVANDDAVANGHARPTDYTVTVAASPI